MNRRGEAVAPPEPALLDALAARITALIPELEYPPVRTAVGQQACSRTAAAQLRRHLDDVTSLLDTSCSAVPAALIRIAHLLYPLAPARIVLPVCTGCARALPVLAKVVEGGRLCHSCATRAERPVCATCGKNTSLRDENGAWRCRGCRGRANRSAARASRRSKQPCGRCGNIRLIVRRTEDGQGLCGSCNPYQRPLVPCVRCARERPVHARLPEGPVCASCHTRPQLRLPRVVK